MKILQADDSTDKFSYVTSRYGVLAREDNTNGWLYHGTDALGNVRQVLDGSVGAGFEAQKVQNHMPYGETFDVTQVTPNPEGDIFGFTGELATENMIHLRARNYIPTFGVFPSLDPLEGGLNDIMMLNRYGYVRGNVPNMIDPSGMSPSCQVNPNCPSGTMKTFTYTRANAVNSAVTLSRLGSNDVAPWVDYSMLGGNSANFISLVLASGGFPMTTGFSGETDIRVDDGWRADCNGKISGNKSWYNHDNLVKYLTGGQSNNGQSSIKELNSGNHVGSISVNTLFDGADKPDTGLDANTIPNYDYLLWKIFLLRLYNIREGDYITSNDPIRGFDHAHGFIIVGLGPALTCDSPGLDDSSKWNSFAQGWGYGSLLEEDKLLYPTLSESPEVFYVVDWSTLTGNSIGLQRQSPRPFYCSRLRDPISSFFNQTVWNFYKIPNTTTVPCNRLYIPSGFNPTANPPNYNC